MIFAAGLGTRLKPLTDTMPKALVSVGGQTLLQRTIQKLAHAGVKRIVINVHHFSEQIKSYLDTHRNFGLDILVSDESDGLLETGGGIKKAQPLFLPEGNILIHNVDILSNVDLQHFYAQQEHSDALLLVSERKTKRYLLFNDDMRLVGWTNIETGEIKSPYADLNLQKCRMYAFSGIHSFAPSLFGAMSDFPDKFAIVDFYLKMCSQFDIHGVVKNDLKLLDVGKLDTIAQIPLPKEGHTYLTDEEILMSISIE